jgi:hypothetical protein
LSEVKIAYPKVTSYYPHVPKKVKTARESFGLPNRISYCSGIFGGIQRAYKGDFFKKTVEIGSIIEAILKTYQCIR